MRDNAANPTLDSLTIHARAAHGTLDVWFDGPGATRLDVSLTSEVLERTTFPRVVERDKLAKEDTVRVKAFGIPGYRVRRTREIRGADGSVKRDVRIDVYPPTNKIVQVAPLLDELRIRIRAVQADEQSPEEASAKPVAVVLDPSAARPLLVQLRPSTRVVLDNASR